MQLKSFNSTMNPTDNCWDTDCPQSPLTALSSWCPLTWSVQSPAPSCPFQDYEAPCLHTTANCIAYLSKILQKTAYYVEWQYINLYTTIHNSLDTASVYYYAKPILCLASYLGLLTPAVVACSTNAGEGLVKLTHVQWRTWMCGGGAQSRKNSQ